MALDEQNEEQQITSFFTTHNSRELSSYFGARTNKLLHFSKYVIDVCTDHISHHNPAHITNVKMNECFANYDDWSPHVAVGNRPFVYKLMANGLILSHQCKRYELFNNLEAEDPIKQSMTSMINDIEEGLSFINFLKSMYEFTRCFFI